jgi:beta-glucosidase
MRNTSLVREIGRATAKEVRATGVDWTFAPAVAVPQDLRWGRTYESYGEDPALVYEYAKAMVEGLQGAPSSQDFLDHQHIIATAKHYLGDGATANGDDQGDALIDEIALVDVHARGYVAAIEAGVQTIMASFSSWQGQKLHGHRYLLTEVLKNRLGHDGIVIGDWNGHGQLPGCSNASSPDAINAGLDMFMVVEDWRELFGNTVLQADNGTISRQRLDDAVRRVLRVKSRAGLFDAVKPSARVSSDTVAAIGAAEHREIARRAVREYLVLLKNKDHVLPLQPCLNVLVAGDAADNMLKQTGGWTITWQGTDNRREDYPGASTILEGIERCVGQAGGHVQFAADGAYHAKPDVAIVVFGEEPYAEFQGDLETLEFEPANTATLNILRKLQAEGIRVVSVFLSGRPLWVSREINASDAFVAAWLPGSEGAGIADVLFTAADGRRQFDFVGKLPFAWPALPMPWLSVAAAPVEPLFPVGFGLCLSPDAEGPEALPEDVPGIRGEKPVSLALYCGRPLAPLAVFLDTAGAEPAIMSGPYAKHATGSIEVQTADMQVQEDALRVTVAAGRSAGICLQGGALNLSAFYPSGILEFQLRVDDAPAGALSLVVNGRSVPLNAFIHGASPVDFQTLRFAMSDFADHVSELEEVVDPFRITADGAATFSVGNIRLLPNSA